MSPSYSVFLVTVELTQEAKLMATRHCFMAREDAGKKSRKRCTIVVNKKRGTHKTRQNGANVPKTATHVFRDLWYIFLSSRKF